MRVFRTTIWDRTNEKVIVERDLGNGVVAFGPDDTPLQLSWVRDDPLESGPSMKLRLSNVTSGAIVRDYQSPLDGLSDLPAITLSRTGSHLAAVAVSVRQNGNKFVSEGDDSTIAVWEVASQKPIRIFKHKASQDLVLSPDGRLLAAWDLMGEITVWTVADGNELRRFRVGRAPVFCLTFGRDPIWQVDQSAPNWLLAVGESSGLITVWDLRAHRPRSVCRGSSFDVRAIDFSPDGALLVTAGRSPSKLWDVATGTCVLDLYVGDEFRAVSFAADGRGIALGWGPQSEPRRGAVDVVQLEVGHGIHTLHGLTGMIQKTAFSPDGRLIAAASHEWQVGIWEWPSGRLRGVLPAPMGRFIDSIGMTFDADGRRFACSAGRQAQLWDLQSGRLTKQWDLPVGLCDAMAFLSPEKLAPGAVRNEKRSNGTIQQCGFPSRSSGGPYVRPFESHSAQGGSRDR